MTKKVIIIYVTIMVLVAAATFLAQRRYTPEIDKDYLETPEEYTAPRIVSMVIESEYAEDSDEDSDELDVVYHARFDENVLFDSKVVWPDVNLKTVTNAVYHQESGSDNQGVWFEGKGFFMGKPDDIYHDLLDPKVMGLSNMTQSLEKKYIRETDQSATYLIHVEMDNEIKLNFDVDVWINCELDKKGAKWLITYDSHKFGGGSIIKNMHEYMIIEAMNQNWFRVFYQSRYNASVLKSEDISKHYEAIFERWASLNKTN